MKAINIHQQGGPEVLRVEEVPSPDPGEAQAKVKLASIGVNYLDIYQRSGAYIWRYLSFQTTRLQGRWWLWVPALTD